MNVRARSMHEGPLGLFLRESLKGLGMPKQIAGLLAVATLTAMLAFSSHARAEVLYPGCAELSGRAGGATNYGFDTFAQCRADISGVGGSCYENPAYPDAGPKPPSKKKSRRY